MKIAMVSENADPGGYVAELAAALSRNGDDVTVYTRRQGDGPDSYRAEPGYHVVCLPAGPAKPVSRQHVMPHLGEFAARLADDWRGQSPDVVHAHYWLSGLAALLATGQQPPPVVLTYHALASLEHRHVARSAGADSVLPQRIQMERLVGRKAAWILATCSDEIDELVTLGVPRSKTTLVPGGVDVHAFAPEEVPPTRKGRFRLLGVGQMAPHGGLDDVVLALAKVPAADLVIMGGPPADQLRYDEDAKRLRLRAQQTGVADRVRFVGHQPQHQRARLMRWADAVVCAPWYEPMGLAALEAMASGTAVIATDVGCLRDSVVHGVTGEHVPERRPDALAATLNRLATDAVSLQEYGVAGRDRATSRFAWDRIAVDASRIYEQQLR